MSCAAAAAATARRRRASIRKLEKQLDATGDKLAECAVPPEPVVGLPPPPQNGGGTPWEWAEESAREQVEHEVSAAMIEMTAMALACDLTRVVTIQDTNAQDPEFPWLNLGLPYFGDGGQHMSLNLPCVLAGGLGPDVQMGRHLALSPPGAQYGNWDMWPASVGSKLGQVWTRIQNLFGVGNFAGWPEYSPIDLG